MTDFPRLIEHAFPLKQASLDSVHEKNVRHGHISTLHIWPARRPLAACRAALIATLLPDPGDPEKRRELCEKIGGKVVKKIERKKGANGQTVERVKEETEGGILHWGRETENAETLEWFRREIRKAYGGRAPRVLDPFAGGGAIPLEAMRLGCEATAVDINPVAWFILKCTLEYPQKLAGQTRPLPEFILHNDAFMAEFFRKAKGYGKAETKAALGRLHNKLKKKPKRKTKKNQASLQFRQETDEADKELQADLAWHVRAWGQWVLDRARRELAQDYPTYADFEPIEKDHVAYEHQPMRLVPLREDGTPDIDSLNAEFTEEYLEDKRNPRWVAKPTVAYLWARTVTCKNCRATVPLLKTRWLCKKPNKRVLLAMTQESDSSGISFDIQHNVPAKGGNAAQKRAHDKQLGVGTMSRAGARCPSCLSIMTMEDIRLEGQSGRLGGSCYATVTEGPNGKEFRKPTPAEIAAPSESAQRQEQLGENLPFGMPSEPIPQGASRAGGGSPFTVHIYGLTDWGKMFTARQATALAVLALSTRRAYKSMESVDAEWNEGLLSYLVCTFSRTADYLSTQCVWENGAEEVKHAFMRWALPITWDFAEANPLAPIDRFYRGGLNSTTRVLNNLCGNEWGGTVSPKIFNRSAIAPGVTSLDLVVTDPPYYDAIPYSDLMDFFHIWLRRVLGNLASDLADGFRNALGPKWNHEQNDGELIDDRSRHSTSDRDSREVYEDGMGRAFAACRAALAPTGRLVIVFANKNPEAWETLAASVIRAGFCVVGSWPIVTEMPGGLRNLNRASLASSIWLICSPRQTSANAGWDNTVLSDMRQDIRGRLRECWDAGIRGPDFIWAATGPALEAYSKHPVVRKANEPNATMNVGEFLNHVRRMVVDYVVGQVLTGERGSDLDAADRLDDVTAYYLLHRHDFGLDDAPVGACILYATACNLSDTELERTWGVLARPGREAPALGQEDSEETDRNEGAADEASNRSKVKLKAWTQRRAKSMGYEAPQAKAVPLIDRIHRVMHLWKDGDVQKVDEFLDQHALRRNELFKRVLQSLIELSSNNERSLLERISSHIGVKGAAVDRGPMLPFGEDRVQ